ncbi:MAG: TVP38/TMEM64 family protein [Maricaulaceae bacterium]
MKYLPTFFTQMDKQAARSLAVLAAMFAVVALLVWSSRAYINFEQFGLTAWLGAAQDTGWALPLTVFIFALAALIGTPQWILIAAAIVSFGPVTGGLYAWIATLISASLQFWAAKFIGANRLEKLSGDFIRRFISLIRKNGFWTSFAVRLVPTGPFILVNLAAGISGLRFWAFLAGSGIGIIPKILLVAMIAQGLVSASQGKTYLVIFGALAVVILAGMLAARKYLEAQINARKVETKKNA